MVGRKRAKSLKTAPKTSHDRAVQKKQSSLIKNPRKSKKIFLASRKRGRPRKAWWYHLHKNSSHWVRRKRRAWNKFNDLQQSRKHAFLQLIRLSRRRGRPRK